MPRQTLRATLLGRVSWLVGRSVGKRSVSRSVVRPSQNSTVNQCTVPGAIYPRQSQNSTTSHTRYTPTWRELLRKGTGWLYGGTAMMPCVCLAHRHGVARLVSLQK